VTLASLAEGARPPLAHLRLIARPLRVQIANLSLGIPAGILAARILGPEQRGELATFVAGSFLFSTMLALCTHESVPSLLRRGRAPGTTVGTVVVLQVLLGTVAAIASLLLPALQILPEPTRHAIRATQPFFAVACIAYAANHAVSWGVLARSGATAYITIETARQAAYLLLLVVALVGLRSGLRGAVTAFTAALAVQLGVAALLLRRTTRGLRWEGGVARAQVGFGLRALPGRVAEYFFAAGGGDVLVMSAAVGSAGVGYYVVARALTDLSLIPASAAGLLVQSGRGDGTAAPAPTRHILAAAAILTLGGAAALAAIGPTLVRVLFGPPFAASTGLLRILLGAIPALLVSRVLTAWNTRNGLPHHNSAAMGVTAVAFVLTAVPLGRVLGPPAAVAAFVASAWLQTLALLLLRRRTP
jgi:O-antigen/teichoic acid export membrane protein